MNIREIYYNFRFGIENYGVLTAIKYVYGFLTITLARNLRSCFHIERKDANVHIVYLQYTSKHQKKGLEHLNFILYLLGLDCNNILVVDNSIDGNIEKKITDSVQLIGGDNSCYDFSGYDKGIDWLKSNNIIKDSDIIIICNDSFFRNFGHRYLKYFKKYNIVKLTKENRLIGYTDTYPHEVSAFGIELKSWIRTSFYILNMQTLNKLTPLTINISDSLLFSKNCEEFFSKTINISDNYKNYLRTWLFGEENSGGYKAKWYAHSNINHDNFGHFKKKAKCILSEHYLSAKALQVSNGIVSVNTEKVLCRADNKV